MSATGRWFRVMRWFLGCALLGCATGDSATVVRSDASGAASGTAAGAGGMDANGLAPAGSGAPQPAGAGGVAARTAPGLNAESVLNGSCAMTTVQSALLPTHLLFVIDRTGTMSCNPPPTTDSATCERSPMSVNTGQPSKWEIVENALLAAFARLPQDVGVGISYFSNDDACGVHPTPSVPIQALVPAQLAAIEDSLANVTPGGGTPLVGATILAYQHLHALALQGELPGNKFVVLLTDGEQSEQCSEPSRCATVDECKRLLVEVEAPKARRPGVDIRTFVIGAPGSEPARAMLSQLAVAGGTAPEACDARAGACHFDMTRETDFAGALSQTLSDITGRAATCELPLPATGDALDRNRVNVVYSPGDGSAPSVIVQDTHAGCGAGANGWQYAPDGATIQLCGPVCETVRSDRGSRVDVVLGCPVQGPD